jgi:hypothetical protein
MAVTAALIVGKDSVHDRSTSAVVLAQAFSEARSLTEASTAVLKLVTVGPVITLVCLSLNPKNAPACIGAGQATPVKQT